ncbi:hypothetical protein GCM10011571_11350 [Marinithermofilum abyssi]|uniref:SPOR domain-containing protein n=1 Tax=Marinithermofilum abyssi TaxID=1571185 RepID=A0A8J2VDI6_9BACL|nr:SPOR domain-containing protein [Marinithermofilum abyssi]GGE11703.1 hypothetical protein GCM10011571_11350 [Marinithermofilum abyssi]
MGCAGTCRFIVHGTVLLGNDSFLRVLAKAYARGLAKAFGFKQKKVEPKPELKQEPDGDGVFYRVVTGSFENKKNAEERMEELKKKGFDSFIDVYKK